MNALVPIQKRYEIQDHGLNLFFYEDNTEYLFVFDNNDPKEPPVINIEEHEGRLIYIPYSLMLVDAFYNGVLTPMSMMLPCTDTDANSMLAWTIIHAVSDRQNKPPGMTAAMSVTLNCMLCAVAREKIASLDPQVVALIGKEKVNFFEKLFAGEKITDDDLSGRDAVMMLVAEYVDQFFEECVVPLYDGDVSGLIQTISGYYKRFAEATAERVDVVQFHPEVLERL